ncbi:hypothetical protein MVEG_12364 [Podila verticillata NRRL 6337]|uniref:Heterokaryon incompatibility domain-containing protein n=1 Tax=Podila verticillata NRRL 6337 TaxID=1069443 RepID=A0A086TIK4_9FUNG|nr:hypothetical protein MVEG_12364 [Podila verticillata NRRL 6337]
MSLTPPKRLFHVPSMSTVMYKDVADDVKEKGYVAISHVWGSQKMYSADELGINSGVDWKVPLSNTNKISRLVDAMSYYEKEYCWWDVVCMPQDKQNEINLEIPHMGDYYNGAEITFVLSDKSYVIPDEYGMWCDVVDVVRAKRDLSNEQLVWITNSSDFLDFSDDPWFKRVWTLQEAVLSQKLILTGANGSCLDLSDLLDRASYFGAFHLSYLLMQFRKSMFIVEIAGTIRKYRNKELNLSDVLGVNSRRECHKTLDKFYATLGILGYKDFVVDYDISMDDLNKSIARYACSSGDIGWMAVGGDVGMGFIQPMYEISSVKIGNNWKQNTPSVVFNNMIYVQARTFGTIVRCERYTEAKVGYEVVPWAARTFVDWGFSLYQILEVVMQYDEISEEFANVGTCCIDTVSKSTDLVDVLRRIVSLGLDVRKYADKVTGMFIPLCIMYQTATVVKIESGNNSYPLVVCGNADKGDIVVATKIYDDDCLNRCLGIVVSKQSKRKGVCILPRNAIGNGFVDIHTFVA